jgi:hypothetical protein
MNALCGIHFAPDSIASVLAYGNMAKKTISFWMAGDHKQPGGLLDFRVRETNVGVGNKGE